MTKIFSFRTGAIASAVVSMAFMILPAMALADTVGPIDFETYTLSNINGQDGWIKTGPFDATVASVSAFPAASGYGFGTQALRMSDSVVSGSFGDQTFSPGLLSPAGESPAQAHFESSFSIGTTLATLQSGLHMSVSPDNGSGARMSYLRFEDETGGVHVFFDDVTDAGGLGTVATFNEIDIATLSRTSAHIIKFSIDFKPGPANDVVQIYIDGNLVHTGTTWEDYYRYDPEQAGSGNVVSTVSKMLFRESGAANAGNAGNGFLIDNLSLLSSPNPFPTYTGDASCPAGTQPDSVPVVTKVISSTNPVGESFALAPNIYGYLFEALGTFVPTTAPNYFSDAGYTTSDSWTTIAAQYGIHGVAPDKGAHALLADLGSGVGILDWGAASSTHIYAKHFILATSSVQFVIGDRWDSWYNTPYQNQAGMSDNSGSLTLNVYECKAPPTFKVVVIKFIDGVQATASNANSSSFPMVSTTTATNVNGGVETGGNAYTLDVNDAYHATTTDMASGASYATSEVTGGAVVGASCSEGKPYALAGYSSGNTLALAQSAATTTAPSFTGLASDKYVIVRNITCAPAPTFLKVHILKYLDNSQATAISANNYDFPMTATWSAPSGSGSGNYVLGNNHGGAPDLYGADTSPMSSPADYSTSEVTGGNSNVLPTAAQCVPGKYRLLGYKKSAISFANAATQATSTSASFTGLTADEYVLVYDETCATTPPPPPANACTLSSAPSGYTLQNGSAGSDTLTLAPFTMFKGNGGNDIITAGAGNYIICTGKGNDTISIGNGDYTIDAGAGNNTITTGNGAGSITTGTGNDTITTGDGAHTISAGAGNNTITTGDGVQQVTTGAGNDKVTTGSGADTIAVGNGNNTVKSGAGADTITAGSGNDIIDGGAGTDSCSAGGGSNTVTNCP